MVATTPSLRVSRCLERSCTLTRVMLYLILFDFSTVRGSRTLFIIEQCEWRRTTQSPLAIELIQATALFHKEELLSSGFEICIYIHMYTFSRNTSGFAGLHVEFPRGRNAASKQGKWSLIDNSYPPYGERLIPLCTTSARLRLRNLNLYPFLCLLFWLVNIWTVRPSRVFSYFRIICRVAVRTRQYTFPRDDDDDTDLENIHWNIHCIFAEPISTTIVSTSHT